MDLYNNFRSLVRPLLPRTIYVAQLVRRRAPLWRNAGVIFIHIPKNGGTSINTALYGQFMGHYTIAEVQRWAPGYVQTIPAFAVARNPWDRLYSAYRFARIGRGVDNTQGVAMANPGRYDIPEFESFERFVLEWLPNCNLMDEDIVFWSQSYFIKSQDGEINVDFVGHIERLDETVDFLSDTVGELFTFMRSNQTQYHPGKYRELYTDPMRDVVASVYADDGWLGYDF